MTTNKRPARKSYSIAELEAAAASPARVAQIKADIEARKAAQGITSTVVKQDDGSLVKTTRKHGKVTQTQRFNASGFAQ